MLDVGFSEILLTSAIALIVLGPERLPKVARQVGNWMGRARAMARQLSEQLEREVTADELLKQASKRTAISYPTEPVEAAPAIPAAQNVPDAAATSAAAMHAAEHPSPLRQDWIPDEASMTPAAVHVTTAPNDMIREASLTTAAAMHASDAHPPQVDASKTTDE
jgi:sec-independent protein translocase protein TatB